jgi:hypothetical protein
MIRRTSRQIEAIEAIGQVSDDSTLPSNWAEAKRPKLATGVPFIDRLMDGGSEPGDVNVILGPTGGGKTTLSMQLCISIAKRQDDPVLRDASEGGLSVFFSYEDNKRMLQIRAASFAAQVHKNRLRFHGDALSTRGNLADYERELFRNCNLREQPGERERLDGIREWMEKYVRLIDFHAGTHGGRGGVPEVVQRLRALQDKAGMPIRAVFLDWAGDMVRNMLLAKNAKIDSGSLSLELTGLISHVKAEVASQFECTVWVPHQIRGAATGKKPGWLPHHSDAKSCTSFADNAWYAFCIGNKDPETNCCQVLATKTRHGEASTPVICRIDGGFCRLVDVTEHYVVDGMSSNIVPRSNAARHNTNGPPVEASVEQFFRDEDFV